MGVGVRVGVKVGVGVRLASLAIVTSGKEGLLLDSSSLSLNLNSDFIHISL